MLQTSLWRVLSHRPDMDPHNRHPNRLWRSTVPERTRGFGNVQVLSRCEMPEPLTLYPINVRWRSDDQVPPTDRTRYILQHSYSKMRQRNQNNAISTLKNWMRRQSFTLRTKPICPEASKYSLKCFSHRDLAIATTASWRSAYSFELDPRYPFCNVLHLSIDR